MFDWLQKKTQQDASLSGLLEARREWFDQLKAGARGLNHLAQDTEVEFLHLGESLQAFSIANRGNDQAAADFLTRLNQNEEDQLIELLRQFDQGGRSIGQAIGELIRYLKDMTERIESVREFNYEMKDACRSLKMLGVSLKIETTRLEAEDFLLVIDALDGLVAGIDSNVSVIEQAARTARGRLGLACKKLVDRQARFARQIVEIQAQLQSGSRNMNRCHQRGLELGQAIGGESKEISAQINQVVQALQFHDSSRQRMEHVAEAMEEIAQQMQQAEAETKQVAVQSPEQLHGWAQGLIKVQKAQLEGLSSEADLINQRIGQNFDHIFHAACNQKEQSEQLLTIASQQQSELSALSQVLQVTNGQLTSTSTQMRDISGLSGELQEGLQELSGRVLLINENRHALKLLAINSELQAFAAGQKGATLAVVSEQISQISTQLQEMVESKQSQIAQLVELSTNFGQAFATQLETQIQQTDQLKTSSDQAINQLDGQAQAVVQVSRAQADLEGLFHEVQDNLGYHQRLKEGMALTLELLERFESSFERINQRFGILPSESDEVSSQLERVYSMEQERLLHVRALGGGGETVKAEAEVELFDEPSTEAATTQQGAEDLGDNIELF
ncbi:MAG: hypothetical protein RRB13_00910 [bacterium]|nr:hypothetical protein [bacterium]